MRRPIFAVKHQASPRVTATNFTLEASVAPITKTASTNICVGSATKDTQSISLVMDRQITPTPPSKITKSNPHVIPTTGKRQIPLPSLPTPVRVNRLRFHLSKYDTNESNFLISGFEHGFLTGHIGNVPHTLDIKNSSALRQHPEVAKIKLDEEVKRGRIEGPFDRHLVSIILLISSYCFIRKKMYSVQRGLPLSG